MKGLFLIADLGAWILAGSTFGPCLSGLLGLLGTGALSQHGQGLAGAAAVAHSGAVCPHRDPTHLCRSGRLGAVFVPAAQELD